MTLSKNNGQIAALHLNVVHREPMDAVEKITAVAGEGIIGDRHRTTRTERSAYQVLVIDKEVLDSVDLAPGVAKENITTSGVDIETLSPGSRLKLGSEIMLEVSKPCAPCSRLDEVRPGLQHQLEGRRGVLASVIVGGVVSVGDTVDVVSR